MSSPWHLPAIPDCLIARTHPGPNNKVLSTQFRVSKSKRRNSIVSCQSRPQTWRGSAQRLDAEVTGTGLVVNAARSPWDWAGKNSLAIDSRWFHRLHRPTASLVEWDMLNAASLRPAGRPHRRPQRCRRFEASPCVARVERSAAACRDCGTSCGSRSRASLRPPAAAEHAGAVKYGARMIWNASPAMRNGTTAAPVRASVTPPG